ncbi:uncharacterized protein LOC125570199 isoform X2 [Nematostella vectensis]|uniref:uncharacterized protein LOC125570199 isoform X2 n=1 Tax=Nematostella vectensis TaxID=45351 RepID=UPI002076E59C|nr:uncharacterized protein LOC125570199 isoform X2 [Nematostella vectensis]
MFALSNLVFLLLSMQQEQPRTYIILSDEYFPAQNISSSFPNTQVNINIISAKKANFVNYLEVFCGNHKDTFIIGCLQSQLDHLFVELARGFSMPFICVGDTLTKTSLQAQPYVTLGASPVAVSSIISQMADISSATHVFLLGTRTQTNSILPELLSTKLTINITYSAIAGDFENNLNNALQKIDSNKDFVLVVFLESSIIDRALRDAIYNFHSLVKTVIVGDGSEERLELDSKRSDVLLIKMEGYMDVLTSDAIRLTDATVKKSSNNKTHDCFSGTDQDNLSLFNR